jgi:carbon storage regulator CsrA|tara:strand:- start:1273 stop:1563 length:291 start_codon:yes stop_codon:yes gene_type:complete
MLVLSRKQKETLVIDGRIEFEILNADSGSVRIGIRSSNSVEVRRGELTTECFEPSIEPINMVAGQADGSSQTEDTVGSEDIKGLLQLPNPFVAIDD